MKAMATAESSGDTRDGAIQKLQNSLGDEWFGWEPVGVISVSYSLYVVMPGGHWTASVTVEKEVR